jgi:hypothetical protein
MKTQDAGASGATMATKHRAAPTPKRLPRRLEGIPARTAQRRYLDERRRGRDEVVDYLDQHVWTDSEVEAYYRRTRGY